MLVLVQILTGSWPNCAFSMCSHWVSFFQPPDLTPPTLWRTFILCSSGSLQHWNHVSNNPGDHFRSLIDANIVYVVPSFNHSFIYSNSYSSIHPSICCSIFSYSSLEYSEVALLESKFSTNSSNSDFSFRTTDLVRFFLLWTFSIRFCPFFSYFITTHLMLFAVWNLLTSRVAPDIHSVCCEKCWRSNMKPLKWAICHWMVEVGATAIKVF